jgi:hypothetical protein
MKTREMGVVTSNLKSSKRRGIHLRLVPLLIFSMLILSTNITFAHCDTMDGPLIADARKAMGQNNVNYVLKWVSAANESVIRDAFNLVMKVEGLSPEAKELSEKYFFETLVRIHRDGEGMPFTGVKPSGTPVDEKVLAADKSIEIGNLSPLDGKISKDDMPKLTKLFDKVLLLKNIDVNNVVVGREYIEAYVQFFKFAEGEAEGHAAKGHRTDMHSSASAHNNAQ